MKSHYLDVQEIAPRLDDGVDHSAAGRVLVRAGHLRLVWRPGRTYYSGMLNPKAYAPAELEVIGDGEVNAMQRTMARVFTGRFSRGRVALYIDQIRELMKLPSLEAAEIDPKRTLVIEEEK